MPPPFVHLHLHTEYSLLDGGNRIDRLVKRVKELGMPAVGVTDHGNIFGAVAVYLACKEAGIKAILGVEAYVTPPGKPRQDRTYSGGGEGGYHLVLLAENLTGWQNLLVLCSEAYLTGFYYKPRIDRELLEKHAEGLIAINGHLGSEIGEHLLAYEQTGEQRHWDAAAESATWHARVFNGRDEETKRRRDGEKDDDTTSSLRLSVSPSLSRFFIELQHHVPEQNSINKHLIRLARELKLPLVCDNDAHFLRAEDHDAHDTLICISTGKAKSDQDRMRYTPELYVKSPEEMWALFEPYGEAGREALENTARIAERCNVELPLGKNHAPSVRMSVPRSANLPRHDDPQYRGDLTAWYQDYCSRFEVRPFREEPTPDELAAAKQECDTALRMLAEAGLVWRYGPAVMADSSDAPSLRLSVSSSLPDIADIRSRFERELKILCDKNIAAYFLIVWDFVNWGRQNGVPALARGSGVGTMIGYVLGLSNACPVRYGLLFERFTDPDRSEYPDIDIDLCQDGRGRVIDYVRNKYGHVAQIITFGTLKARAAIRDVARVLEIPLAEADKIAKMIPEQLGITLDEALEQEPELKKLYESGEKHRQLIDNARTLEGQARHASVHAAGVIVATRPLHEVVPLYRQSGSAENEIVTQWDGPTCEKMGLLKMDFLGLRTISIVERAKKLIRETLPEEAVWRAVGRAEEYEETKRRRDEETRVGSGTSLRLSVSSSLPHPLDLDRLDYRDQRVFELFRRGETTGVFQFESPGMRRLLIEMKPDRLEDLIAANALFRPGPMDLIPDYNRRKHGQDLVPKVHEIVDRYTAETYGVMVYQEQVMQIVHGLGGIKLRDAYSLIKNISKKKHDKIEKERPKFVEGAQQQGLSKQQAEDLFELILKFAGYGFNKCVGADTVIVDAHTGERTTVGALFRRRREFSIHALDACGKLRARPVTDVVWNGPKPVFQLRTRLGKSITATGNHPFRSLEGWRNLADLRVGDRIAAPRRLTIATENSWPQHEIIVLAGLLSEGNTCHPSCLYFFGNDRQLVDDFAAAAGQFPETVARTYTRADGNRLEVCLSSGRDTRFRKGQRPWNAREAGGTAVAEATDTRCGAYRWAERLGILGLKAAAKHVPTSVFQLCDRDIELFLGRLWAGDGYIAGRSSSTPFYATSSPTLARDVQTLLLRLGIISGIHTKSFRYRGTLRQGYTVHILGEGSVDAFLRRIAPHCLSRDDQVALLRERAAAVAPGLTSRDTVPAEVRAWVDQERRRAGLTWRELEVQSGVCTRELCRVAPSAKRGFRRSTVARLARFFSSSRLAEAADSDMFWDEVVSIEPHGIQDTYDLTVDVDHNFVADGLIVHNSHSTGYAIVAYQTAYLKTFFPNHYMAAFLTYESGAQKVSDWIPYLEDCKKTRFIEARPDGTAREVKVGVEVRPPDVNLSAADFTVVYEDGEPRDALHGHVRFGLGAIKGAGEKAIEAVMSDRAKAGPFTSIFDFCERVLSHGTPGGSAIINKSTIESLVKCGAFDAVHGRAKRAAVAATIEQALSAAQKAAKDKASGQSALFGFGAESPAHLLTSSPAQATPLAGAAAWSETETLQFEKDVLGFYISSHPLEEWLPWMQAFVAVPVSEVQQRPQRERVLLGGLVQGVRTVVVKNGRSAGQKMAIITLEDRTGTIEAVCFTDAYLKYGHLIQADAKLFIIGEVDLARGTPQIVIDRILPIEAAPRDPVTSLDLLLDGIRYNGESVSRLERAAQTLVRHIRAADCGGSGSDAPRGAAGPQSVLPANLAWQRPPTPIRIFIRLPGAPAAIPVKTGEGWVIKPTPALLRELQGALGDACIRLSGPLLARDRDEKREKWGGRPKMGAEA